MVKPMIKLYRFGACQKLFDLSPFCTKVELYLRIAKIPHEAHILPLSEFMQETPKKKLPYIVDDGKKIADSGFIVQYLASKYGDLDQKLTAIQRATGHAIRRMVEESLYWPLLYCRWMEVDAWADYKHIVCQSLPAEAHESVAAQLYEGQKANLWGQGYGRHSRDEIYELGCADVTAISTLLGDKPYMMGNELTALDATVWSTLAGIIVPTYENPLKAHTQKLANVQSYVKRISDLYFPQ